jgi:hypothetical protein
VKQAVPKSIVSALPRSSSPAQKRGEKLMDVGIRVNVATKLQLQNAGFWAGDTVSQL